MLKFPGSPSSSCVPRQKLKKRPPSAAVPIGLLRDGLLRRRQLAVDPCRDGGVAKGRWPVVVNQDWAREEGLWSMRASGYISGNETAEANGLPDAGDKPPLDAETDRRGTHGPCRKDKTDCWQPKPAPPQSKLWSLGHLPYGKSICFYAIWRVRLLFGEAAREVNACRRCGLQARREEFGALLALLRFRRPTKVQVLPAGGPSSVPVLLPAIGGLPCMSMTAIAGSPPLT